MNDLWTSIADYLSIERALTFARAITIVVVGLLLAKFTSIYLAKAASKKVSTHHMVLIRRTTYYLILGLFGISALRELGFNLAVLLGAAGVLSVALGFASQTSASNLISGLFLLAERPFSISDVIKVGDTVGEVISIDLLSVKLRTFDNLFVRIPNETLIKSQVTTLTKFPIRRIDLQIGVAYKENIENVRKVLFEVADKNNLCLEEPKPLFVFLGFGDSSINLQFSVWTKRQNFLELKTSIQQGIKAAFDEKGIEIPFPHRSLYTGTVTDPFPIRIVENPADKP
jgi:small-conductance mechanosensitive channel